MHFTVLTLTVNLRTFIRPTSVSYPRHDNFISIFGNSFLLILIKKPKKNHLFGLH
jgi:hypothetical protein